MMHLFVFNPRSFKDAASIIAFQQDISACFGSKNEYRFHVSRYPRDAVSIVSKYAARFSGGIRVYAIGGDGVLFDCLNGVIGHPAAELAAVPYGKTNDFARAITENNVGRLKNIKALISAPSAMSDVVYCGGNYYLNYCSVGVESAAVIKWYRMQSKMHDPRGKRLVSGALTLSGVLSLFDRKLVDQYYELTIDGRKYDGRYAVINFSNGPYCGGNKSVYPKAVFNDGFIDMLMVKSASSLKLMTLIPSYLEGGYHKYPGYITHLKACDITVRSERPLFINLDGEYFIDTKLRLKIIPSSVKIIAAGGTAFGREAWG